MFKWLINLFKKKDKIIVDANEVSEKVTLVPKHYQIAMKELGVKEVVGKNHNPRVIQYHDATSLDATSDEIAWCSSFANWCMKQAGIKGTNSASARSWLNWGKKVIVPEVGDVVIFWRGKKDGWQGHVAFFSSEDSKYVTVLGGNQSDSVCYAKYPKSQLLGYRRA